MYLHRHFKCWCTQHGDWYFSHFQELQTFLRSRLISTNQVSRHILYIMSFLMPEKICVIIVCFKGSKGCTMEPPLMDISNNGHLHTMDTCQWPVPNWLCLRTKPLCSIYTPPYSGQWTVLHARSTKDQSLCKNLLLLTDSGLVKVHFILAHSGIDNTTNVTVSET